MISSSLTYIPYTIFGPALILAVIVHMHSLDSATYWYLLLPRGTVVLHRPSVDAVPMYVLMTGFYPSDIHTYPPDATSLFPPPLEPSVSQPHESNHPLSPHQNLSTKTHGKTGGHLFHNFEESSSVSEPWCSYRQVRSSYRRASRPVAFDTSGGHLESSHHSATSRMVAHGETFLVGRRRRSDST